jgi:hypothetical protein
MKEHDALGAPFHSVRAIHVRLSSSLRLPADDWERRAAVGVDAEAEPCRFVEGHRRVRSAIIPPRGDGGSWDVVRFTLRQVDTEIAREIPPLCSE